ncbi:MAG: RNA polymerase sigma factor [Pirellulales bacterium]|nr:RNA polymerase sigma factor [Pirellulales bacterium]
MDPMRSELAAGQHEAFAALYDALADRLHHYLVATLGSRADADDVLQETFVRLVRHRRKLRDAKNLTAYVFTVARNEALRFRERASRRRAKQTRLSPEELFVPAAQQTHLDDAAERIAHGLAQLRDEQREVVELKAFAGLTLAEIADVSGLPQGTVASRYRAALFRLQVLLREEEL